jgi:putative PIN family toxin of toxin-antitoxin system
MKVVVDSNVAVAGLLWEGPPNQILKWARQGFVNLLACHETVRELGRILQIQKFQPRLSTLGVSADEVCAYYMNLVSFVPSPKRIPDRIRDDPFDKMFVGLASEYGAQLIVTGDSHLLELRSHKGIQIVTPRDACKVVETVLAAKK